ncbi:MULTISPECIES: hypothetical protein [unclassified Gordonia (in: high G+C Gram-positive bacteria)]|uniref:hypothetical protein n=1 Tax=unclassified Gordonia (in: high G+C Gram-positive bacteria) TaxID=2657482 RepID=UPI001F10C930|nr:hypothetical protein [Gordonia sp. ABSL49_1]MCH5645558.1 hypothetical protein [Gordonia sp. ABSL49_1]
MSGSSEAPPVDRAAFPVLVLGLLLWFIALGWFLLRVDLWIFGLIAAAVMWFLCLVGVVCAVMGAVRMRRPAVAVLAVLPVMVFGTVIVGDWAAASPRAWFITHRALYDQALNVDPGDDYYGQSLPLHLRYLTVDGRVSGGDIKFFPLWIGTPDDAGGILHSPGRSPAGFDMYGMMCRDPVSLGDDWWMCGVKS